MMTVRFAGTFLLFAIGSLFAWLPAQQRPNPPSPNPNLPYLSQIGWTRLVARMKKEKKELPTGRGVRVAHVEPSVSPDPKKALLRPDLAQVFEKPNPNLTLTCELQPDGPASGHSTGVAQYFYGQYSVSPGIAAVEVIEPGQQFIPQWLGLPNGAMRKSDQLPKISNHSYVEGKSKPAIVRRLDEFIAVNDHLAVVAVGVNDVTAPVAPLFGSSYNALVIGLTNGKAARGAIKAEDDGAGRIKPDLVVPSSVTSLATPIAASAAAVLVEAAAGDPIAAKPVVLKACLMAAAEKQFVSEFLPSVWSNTEDKPLHPHVGAGQLDIDIAHLVLSAGRVKPAGMVDGGLNGWAYESIADKDTSIIHSIDVPDEQETTSISVVLTWNRRIVDGQPVVPDLDLDFGRLDANHEFDRHLAKSVSKVDNVEIIYRTTLLPPGRYGFKVTNESGEPTDYAIAWHITTKPHKNLRRDPPQKTRPAGSNSSLEKIVILTALISAAVMVIVVFRRRLGLV
jgi:hypothetical protein